MGWSRPDQIVVLVGAAAVVAVSGLLVAVRRPAPPIRIIEAPAPAELIVQVDGAVVRPGLYRLAPGARVADGLRAAGGLRADADEEAVNQARALRDGDRVTVPHRQPPVPQTAGDPDGLRPTQRPRDRSGPANMGPLDLNRASAADLEALPGIGPVLARRIVEHRAAHGPFQHLEDLLRVRGVGPRLLDRLRHRVVIR